jgi:hypothetical protein
LLAGYAYSDFVVRRLSPRTQLKLHTVLLWYRSPCCPSSRALSGSRRAAKVRHGSFSASSPARSGCRTSCFPRRVRWCRSGTRERGPERAPIGCSRCRISRRCWRSSAIRSCSSPSRRRARRRGAGRPPTRSSSASAPPRAGRA